MTEPVTHDSAALSLLALGLLSEPEARAVEAHLATCTDCSREWAQRRDTVTLLDAHVPAEAFITARADPDAALLAAPQVAPTGYRPPRS